MPAKKKTINPFDGVSAEAARSFVTHAGRQRAARFARALRAMLPGVSNAGARHRLRAAFGTGESIEGVSAFKRVRLTAATMAFSFLRPEHLEEMARQAILG